MNRVLHIVDVLLYIVLFIFQNKPKKSSFLGFYVSITLFEIILEKIGVFYLIFFFHHIFTTYSRLLYQYIKYMSDLLFIKKKIVIFPSSIFFFYIFYRF